MCAQNRERKLRKLRKFTQLQKYPNRDFYKISKVHKIKILKILKILKKSWFKTKYFAYICEIRAICVQKGGTQIAQMTQIDTKTVFENVYFVDN